MSTLIRSAVVLTVTAAGLAAQIISPLPPIRAFQQVQTFGMVGLAEGQTARLNVLNPGVPSPAATGAMCSALLTFFDDQGASLKSATVTVIPGKSDSYDLDSDKDLKLAVNQRRQIRATIQIPPVVPPPGSLAPQFIPCTLISTLEVFDTITGKTQVVIVQTQYVTSPAIFATTR